MESARDILDSVVSQLHELQTRSDSQLEDVRGSLQDLDLDVYRITRVLEREE